MTEIQIDVLRTYADNGMSVLKTAKALGKKRCTIDRHFETIFNNTGKNPLVFQDLAELLKMAEKQENKSVHVCRCKVCGAHFEAPNYHYRICSDKCRAIAQRENDAQRGITRAEYMRRYKKRKLAENAEPVEEYRQCNAPELSIAEVNEMARAQGMSYGQYVAKLKGD
jgi:predicted nucleic acid-binding Zn ribbon protein